MDKYFSRYGEQCDRSVAATAIPRSFALIERNYDTILPFYGDPATAPHSLEQLISPAAELLKL